MSATSYPSFSTHNNMWACVGIVVDAFAQTRNLKMGCLIARGGCCSAALWCYSNMSAKGHAHPPDSSWMRHDSLMHNLMAATRPRTVQDMDF